MFSMMKVHLLLFLLNMPTVLLWAETNDHNTDEHKQDQHKSHTHQQHKHSNMPHPKDIMAHVQDAPALTSVEVEEWLAYHGGTHYLGAYGAKNQHLGWTKQTVTHQKEQGKIVVDHELRMTKDDQGKGNDLFVQSQRVYQDQAPYALLSYQMKKIDRGVHETQNWSYHTWKRTQGEQKIEKTVYSKETLRAQVGINPRKAVGTTWYMPVFADGSDHRFEIKIIDQRFEYRGGLWTRMVEISQLDHQSAQSSRSVIDLLTQTWSVSIADQIRLVAQSQSNAMQGTLNYIPRTLVDIHKQRGQLDEAKLQQIMHMRKANFKKCYQNFLRTSPHQAVRLTLRLDIATDGLLQSVGAVEKEYPALRNCILKSLKGLRFHKPKKGAAMLAYPLNFTP